MDIRPAIIGNSDFSECSRSVSRSPIWLMMKITELKQLIAMMPKKSAHHMGRKYSGDQGPGLKGGLPRRTKLRMNKRSEPNHTEIRVRFPKSFQAFSESNPI